MGSRQRRTSGEPFAVPPGDRRIYPFGIFLVMPTANRHNDFMRQALRLAEEAYRIGEVPVGAVVVRDERVIGTGYNRTIIDRDPTLHAEMVAIRDACRREGGGRLEGCTIYVTLEPCPMCAGAIVNARVGRLVYGASDPKMGAVESLYEICDDQRLNHRPQIIRGVMAPECRGILREFFKERRRQNKEARRAAG